MENGRTGIKAVIENGRQTVLMRAVTEGIGPPRSIALYYANRLSGGRLRPDLTKYFGPPEGRDYQPTVELEEAHGILSDIDKRILGEERVPEDFICEDYRKWVALKSKIDSSLDTQNNLTDYVLFDRANNYHYLFAARSHELVVIRVDSHGFNEQDLKNQVLNNLTVEIPAGQNSGEFSNAVSTELAIQNLIQMSSIDGGSTILRRMSSITNDFTCQRNIIFEREGEMFTDLRHMGVWSLGEFQALNQNLFSRGVHYDVESKQIRIDQDMAREWIRLRRITLQNETPEGTAQAKDELKKYAREKLYFEMVLQYFKENPQAVSLFLQSDGYQRLAMEFKDRYLSSIGLTEHAVAANILANNYLLAFEGNSPQDSASQVFLARVPDFHKTISAFIDGNSEIVPPLPSGDAKEEQVNAINRLFNLLKTDDYSFTRQRLNPLKKAEILAKARNCFTLIRTQIKHNKINRAILRGIENKLPIVNRGVFTTVITNLGLARVSGENKFTVTSWFPNADDNLPEGKPLPEFTPTEVVPAFEQVERVLRSILNGQSIDGYTAYGSQEKRILESAPLLLSYLQHNDSLPVNVRNFMKTLGSPELTVRVLERFGPIADNDPLIINRFFPDGFAQFQKSAIYRYVFEFVRGVETNIILKQQHANKDKILRRFGGLWENHDFSAIDESTLQFATRRTIRDAAHRIDILNHTQRISKRSLKDWQEFFEKSFGWDTLDMKFLRWEKFWNVWDSLGGTWDCICFSRKSIFNPRVFQQW